MKRNPVFLNLFEIKFGLAFVYQGLRVFCFAVFFFGNFDFASAQIPAFRKYSLKEGLPQSEISSLFEDSRGFVWVGTKGGGLIQFDGYNFKIFNQGQNLDNNFICDIHERKNGELAVGASYGGINYFKNRSFYQNQTDLIKYYSELKKIVVLGNQTIAVSNKSILSLDQNSSKAEVLYSFHSNVVNVFCAKAIGNRWILASIDSGLMVVDVKLRSRSILLNQKTHLRNHKVIAVNELQGKRASMVSEDGYMSILDFADGWPSNTNWEKIPEINLNAREKVVAVVFGTNGQIKWYATDERRVASSSGEEINFKSLRNGSFQQISSLLIDKNQNLWIGTNGSGVIIKPSNSVLNFDNFSSLRNNHLKAVFRTSTGLLLTGGAKTGLIVINDSAKKSESAFFPELSIHCISEGPKAYYLGCSDGLYLVDKNNLTIIKRFTEPRHVVTMRAADGTRLFIGSYGNGPWILESDSKLSPLSASNNQPDYCYGFEPNRNGTYFIPSNNGLWELNPDSLKTNSVTMPDSIGRLFFMTTTDVHGTIWFATPYGLAGLTKKGWRKITMKNGLSSELIYTLNGDSNGNIWLGTNAGLDRITVDDRGNVRNIRNFGPAEGYEGYEANMRASFVEKDHLYICTIEGLFSVPLLRKNLEPGPPKPVITALKVNYGSGKWNDSLTNFQSSWFLIPDRNYDIKEGSQGVAFSYQSINPLYPQKLKYSFWLEGVDKDWSPATFERVAYFGALDGGNYRFHVRTTYDGISFSRPEKLDFTIVRHWYQNGWYMGLGFLLIIFFLIYLFRSFSTILQSNSLTQKDYITPERTSQFLLLFASVIHPISFAFSNLDPVNHEITKFLVIGVTTIVFSLFLLTVFFQWGKRNAYKFLQIAFFLFIGTRINTLIQTNLNPYYVVSFLFICSLAYLVLDKLWQVILFGIFISTFSGWCLINLHDAQYSPAQFFVQCLILFVILAVTLINKQKYQYKLQFSNAVVNTGPVLVLGFKNDGSLVFSSDNLYNLLGYDSWQVLGKSWWNHVMDIEQESIEMLTSLKSSVDSLKTVRVKRMGGEVRTFQFTGRAINADLTVMIGQDTTDAQSIENKFEQLIENATDCIYQTDFYGSMLYANPQTAYLLGVKAHELIGKHFSEFIRDDKRKEVLEFYNQQFTERSLSTYLEFPVVTRAGNVRWLGFQVSILTKMDGKTIDGYLSIGRDITERLEAEQLIQHQHKNITDSVNYASRIKQALLPDENDLKSIFAEVGIINQPKDIIGGDFYWIRKINKRSVFVLGDGTGHGVPGAFITTIAVGLLGQIIKENSHRNSEEILSLFNKALSRLLRSNSETDSNDFVEMAICIFDPDRSQIEFISSGIELHLLRDGILTSYKNGSSGLEYKFDYQDLSVKIDVLPDDRFFTFTDGMYDQIGGPDQKRFMKRRLLDIILSHDDCSISDQIEVIKERLSSWQENSPQIDDRLLVAFKLMP